MAGKYKGDSGGPVVNSKGEVIGVVVKGLPNGTGQLIDGLFRATSVRDLKPLISWWQDNKARITSGELDRPATENNTIVILG